MSLTARQQLLLLLEDPLRAASDRLFFLAPAEYDPWVRLASFRPSVNVQTALLRRGPVGDFFFHKIEEAKGDTVSLDFYSIEITRMPVGPDGNQISPSKLLRLIRMDLEE